VVAAVVAAGGLLAVILVVPSLDHPSGAAGTGVASGKASLRWSYPTGINLDANQEDSPSSSPTVVDGTVYAGGNNGDVYAFNAASGHLDWHVVTASAESGPTVVDGTVYVGSAGGM
jgi:outer membrane protein assembly factor BamB